MSDPAISPALIKQHGLTPEEFDRIKGILGREPNYTELGIFSVMWSEHCSYKNSRPLLKTFPTKSPKILVGAGEENAGIIDIGDGLAIAFKIESHNHPSAVEPFQGAATGVGGIIRDIFTMGARPVCAINSLRFGPITEGESAKAEVANNRRLFAGVVSGIAHYGNCFGIPTVAGEVYFDKSYEGNPLVNAFCLGVLRHDQIARGAARGIGNPVFYVGPATGRDGLAGAAFASQDLTQESADQQRGAVQVGDPFMEKLVMEACLELLATDAVAGIQDMGAAGLTCSTCETASRAGTGIEIDLSKVPQRAPNMTPYEIMLSESQERMLIIVHKGREAEVKRIFDKWDLPWAEIGFVTDTSQMVVKNRGEMVANIPAKKLADEAPLYQREFREPEYLKAVRAFTPAGVPELKDAAGNLKSLLAWPTIASKNWVYRQYDHMVRDGTVVCPGSDAAVIRIKADSLPNAESNQQTPDKFIAMKVDCNAAYVYLDPYEGAKTVVAEVARNLACAGAVPLGSTDNLNYGNPHNQEIFWQLRESVRGLAEACRAFNAPVTGGNVSLYNQNPNGPIDPTPTVAMVGLVAKAEHITTQWFKDEGDVILLLGEPVDMADPLQGLGGSAYLQTIHGLKTGTPPRCDLAKEKDLHLALLALIHSGVVKSAHDCSEGGLAVALAESCISQQLARETPRLIGAEIDLSNITAPRLDALLFGETQSRVVISVAAVQAQKVLVQAKILGVPAMQLGIVRGTALQIKTHAETLNLPTADLHDAWFNAIARAMDKRSFAMSPSIHFIASWLVAAVVTDNPRDRKLVTLAGVLPDLDGAGIVVDIVGGMISGKEDHFQYYQQYHHYLLHGWPGALVVAAVLAIFAREKFRTALFCLLTFHLHLLCDFFGSRGPDPGDIWPIAYSEPLFRSPIWYWKGQWPLDGWQNGVVFVVVFIAALWVAAKKGASFLEFFGRRVDSTFVNLLQTWANLLRKIFRPSRA